MKRLLNLVLLQTVVSLISGILFSKMSFIGQIGITIAYKEYTILKTWWKAALLVLSIQLLVIAILWLCKRFLVYKTFVIVNLVFIILGIIGLFYTYYDFTSTSHKYMNSQFHWGGYLVWIGWFINCLYFFILRVTPLPVTEEHISSSDSLHH